jgi:mRNA interferase RelE/StbE
LSYKIAFKSSVSKDLKKIDKKKAKEILVKIEAELNENADKYPVLKGKYAGLRKFRTGDYRIIYSIINDNTVLILRVAHRKEAYKN